MSDFVAYYQVSTDRQGLNGLGLDAQRQAVMRYVGAGQLVAEFTKIESGRRHANRPSCKPPWPNAASAAPYC